MLVKDITSYLDTLAPPAYAESYDNVGLLVGDANAEVTKAIITLDVTEAVVEEAIKEDAQLIIAHHPIIFGGLKRLTGKTYVERTVMKAIKHDVAIYVAHTNLDNVQHGVNAIVSEKLGLLCPTILAPKAGLLKKLVTFVPNKKVEQVRAALFQAGAGHIGNYSETSYNSEGYGTFKGDYTTTPHVGEKGVRHQEPETRLETIIPNYLEGKVIAALKESHPYEEVAFDIVPISNINQTIGSGMIGELEEGMEEMVFLEFLKKTMNTDCIRYTPLRGKPIRRVAVCGGSGSFLLGAAIAHGADVFITGDFKYHDFFDAEGKVVIADIGHYESEQFTGEWFHKHLTEKFPNFALLYSSVRTNPVNYL